MIGASAADQEAASLAAFEVVVSRASVDRDLDQCGEIAAGAEGVVAPVGLVQGDLIISRTPKCLDQDGVRDRGCPTPQRSSPRFPSPSHTLNIHGLNRVSPHHAATRNQVSF